MQIFDGLLGRCLLATALCGLGVRETRAADPPAPAATPAPATGTAVHLNHGRFENLSVYPPAGTPKSVVLLLSGKDGGHTLVPPLIRNGAMVVVIDTEKLEASLNADPAQCVFPDGDLENLSHFVQAYFRLPTYLHPMLVGEAGGADLAYAVLAQAPKDTFSAALTLNFCPTLEIDKPLCKSSGLDYAPRQHARGVSLLPAKSIDNPWVALQPDPGTRCASSTARAFVAAVHGAASMVYQAPGRADTRWLPPYQAAFQVLASREAGAAPAPPAALGNLPIVEVPAVPGTTPTESFAIILSGDGGWAGLDRDVATALAAKGIPIVGLDSLRYFWTARTPDGIAADLDRMIRYYLVQLHKKRVLLIGYSQGADVLPFAVNRLPAATRASVSLTTIMGMSEHALFEFHVSSWLTDDNSGPLTLPEVDKLMGMPVLCIYGSEEDDSLCPKLDPKKMIVVKLKGGHHFDGDYAGLARQILAAAKP